jgi:hypothetical protein
MVRIFCNLSKALDCVKRVILLNKLFHYRVRGTCDHWFKSYLTNRKQKVVISKQNLGEESFSSWETIINAVPQVSILGPLLFLIYINGILYGLYHTAEPVIYADDTSALITARNTKALQIKAKITLEYMSKWFLINGLTLNIEKTNIVKFSSTLYLGETFQIIYQNNAIKECTNIKFLGLELDKHIKWKNHIKKILPKMSSACFIISAVYSYSNMSTLKVVYFA